MDREKMLELEESRLSWLPSIGLFILFFLLMFWATQMKFDPDNPKQLERERINRANMQQYANKLEVEASKLGRKFRAKQCYGIYLRKLALMEERLGYPKNDGSMGMNYNYVSDPMVHDLIETARSNMGCYSGFDDGSQEFRKEAVAFEKWQKANLHGRPEDKIVTLWKKNGWSGLARWASVFYGRGILLAIFFFPLMMWRRMKGARRTIAENPVRYIIACLFWPFYMWHYPFGVLQEAWLEIQLRRLGPLFRQLTHEERITVRRVAAYNKSDRSEWISDFQRRNEGLFERTAFAAMLGVIVLHLCCVFLLPTPSCAEIRSSVVIAARAGPSGDIQIDHGDEDGISHASAEIMQIADEMPEPDLIVWWKLIDTVFQEQRRLRMIPHVPYLGWLVASFITAIQSAGEILRHNGGNQNAERNQGNLRGNRAACVYLSSVRGQ